MFIGFIRLSKLTRAEFSPRKAAGVLTVGLLLIFEAGFGPPRRSKSPRRRSFKLLLFCRLRKSFAGDADACWADLLRFEIMSNSSKSEPGVVTSPKLELFPDVWN